VALRVAAIDCGTNALRLLVADVDAAAGRLVDVRREHRIVRLGEGVDATGQLGSAAMLRALDTTADYARWCARLGVERVRFVATSATRDAGNAAEFTAGVRAAIGVEPEVLSGAEEARLSFTGATRGLLADGGPYLVVDLGGGSTEFVLGAGEVLAAVSVDVGSVRITERHLHGDPPGAAELTAARRDVGAAIDVAAAAVDLSRARVLVGVAGTVTTLTSHALRLPADDLSRVHGCELDVAAVRAACGDLIGMSRLRRARLPYVPSGRVDVIGAGALIWDLIVERVAREARLTRVLTSVHDILDGVAWALAGA